MATFAFIHGTGDAGTPRSWSTRSGIDGTSSWWPSRSDVPVRFVLCRDDRSFPAAWLRPIVNDRLQIVPDELASGHCMALSRPRDLAALLERYADSVMRAA